MRQELTQDFLKSILEYDEITGLFKWIIQNNKRSPGWFEGCERGRGYRQVKIKEKKYLAHRIAWLYVYGSLPNKFLDHIDGNRSNNKIENLREADEYQNQQNIIKPRVNNKTGLLGVIPYGNRFTSQIFFNGKSHHLGIFNTKEEAHEAYLLSKRVNHEFCTI